MDGLCVSRKPGESIEITTPEGRNIKVTIGHPSRGGVIVIVDADKEVKILRSELVDSGGW